MNWLKILVFTVSSWNSKVGANSWATLLEQYDSENIANIYIRDEIPDSKVCSRYFNISENKIIKSIFNRKTKTGKEVLAVPNKDLDQTDLKEHNERYNKMKKKRRYSMLFARELVWKVGKWKTAELNNFLDDFKPNIILHSMEGYIHLNRIIEYAIKRTGAKAIGYFWDDNFTYKQSSKLGYKIYRYFQRKSLKSLAKQTQAFLAITPKTKKEADNFFGVDCKIITKPLNCEPVCMVKEINYPINILYTGNLLIGRDRSLVKFVEVLREYNKNEIKYKVDVYTSTELNEQIKASLNCEFCFLREPIKQCEVLELQKKADLLLFLEDVDGKDAKVARLSFSTKITDYLSSGKAIIAVGNKDTAPIEYFIENDCAFVATTQEEISQIFKKLENNLNDLNEYAKKACMCGLKNHKREQILKKFDYVLKEVYKEKMNNESYTN